MAISYRLDRLAPDVTETVTRFPVAVLFALALTLTAILTANDWLIAGDRDAMRRLAFGFAAGGFMAVAGRLVAENLRLSGPGGVALALFPSIVVFGLFQLDDTIWVVPGALAGAVLLMLSTAPGLFDRARGGREDAQDRFWWINHRAIISGAIAGVAVALVLLGLFAIHQALSLLFGIDIDDLIGNWLMPLTLFLFAPLYWLSTIPRLADYEPLDLTEPDFLSRAIGFLGQFVLTPLLFAYALILLAYAVQIAVTSTFPDGIVGWLVLTFVVTGAANWLVLHPEFMREKPLVRWFRRLWPLLTIIPLGLFAWGVYDRIAAYGLTPERVVLVLGGVWAVLVTLAFLLPFTRDIRLIPGLAAILLLLGAVGPQNVENLSRINQFDRLEAALAAESMDEETAATARGAIFFLMGSTEGRRTLDTVLVERDVALPAIGDSLSRASAFDYMEALSIPRAPDQPVPDRIARVDAGTASVPVDVSATPLYLGRLQLSARASADYPGLTLRHTGDTLHFATAQGETEQSLDLTDWLARQTGDTVIDPALSFTLEGRDFLIVVNDMSYRRPDAGEAPAELLWLNGSLFAEPVGE